MLGFFNALIDFLFCFNTNHFYASLHGLTYAISGAIPALTSYNHVWFVIIDHDPIPDGSGRTSVLAPLRWNDYNGHMPVCFCPLPGKIVSATRSAVYEAVNWRS
jgi:hypothetical protein